GTNVLNDGLIDVDRLVLTTNSGIFEFNGGTLVTRGAFISNMADFVVGASGTNPAVWDVRAGVSNHFASARVIVGSGSSFSQLLLTNGALLTNSGNGVLGLNAGANSNLALVSGTGSQWRVASNLHVGTNGSFNQIVVTNGGSLSDVDGDLGYSST